MGDADVRLAFIVLFSGEIPTFLAEAVFQNN